MKKNTFHKLSRNLTLISLITLALAFNGALTNFAVAATTKIYVDPPLNTANQGNTFTINIKIENALNVRTWALSLRWNYTVLYTNSSLVTQGAFFNETNAPDGTYFIKNVYPNQGTMDLSVVSLGPQSLPGADGNGTLVTITFMVLITGKSYLDMYDTSLVDPNVQELPHVAFGGYFSNIAPVAVFSFAPSSPIIGDPVTFNATDSIALGNINKTITSPGFNDTIASYTWDFGDANITTVGTPVIYHVYAAAGDFTVNLTVTDDFGVSNSTTLGLHSSGHNVAILDVTPSSTSLAPGDTITINVTAANLGSETENFNVTASYDSTTIQTQTNITLNAGTNQILTFTWNTTGIATGAYTLKAEATVVPNEKITSDNTFTNGQVTIAFIVSGISLSASPTTITVGASTTLSGAINVTRFGVTVTIQYRPSGGTTWTNLTATTNATSQYSRIWTPTPAMIYEVKAGWPGDSKTLAAESPVITVTVNKLTSSVSIDVSPASVSQGSNVTITGTISPQRGNVAVTIQIKSDTTWSNLTTVQTNQNGNYAYTWTTTNAAVATYSVKAVWNGDENTQGSESATKTVSIESLGISPILLYAGVGAAIIIILAILVYFLRIRKPPK